MSRTLSLPISLVLVALAGCASNGAPPASPDAPPVAGVSCNADAARAGALGKVASADVVQRAGDAAGARNVRVLKPGQMVTMEYLEGRLNIDVDDNNVVTNLRCG
ncbi:hypothetical protein EER27_09700 [Lysobacter psychrotolerans]|uniref:Peptidase inhibitor I78 family protein n=1 Tax=Montanilutibacter psychrotolerans TaxID=1327343 RepID=A0A3M8SXT1_9GAMM|nr:I78 family peptidase inhibitor [Lysobacter psychrotolerans]RNF83650.1 hypothetical protein EER27_09700 [Lysobacter psychrotolerans]